MFISADTNRIYHTLNVLRVADYVMFLSSVNGLDENVDHLMSCIIGQGIPPNPVLTIVDLHTLPKKVFNYFHFRIRLIIYLLWINNFFP